MPPYRQARPKANLVSKLGDQGGLGGAALMSNLRGDVREGSVQVA